MKHALILMVAFSFSVAADRSVVSSAQQRPQPVAGAMASSIAVPQCSGGQLSVRHLTDDAAMGGERSIEYAFTNTSTAPCLLKGYPRFELLHRAGRARVRVVQRDQWPGEDQKQPPRWVRLGPGQEAWFRIHYNSGGAGYMGKPCPTFAKIRITAPGTRRGFILREQIQSCREVEVSPVRRGLPTE